MKPAPRRLNDRWIREQIVDRSEDEPSLYGRWHCPECDGTFYYTYLGEPCFDCAQARNPFAGSAPLVLIDAGGEDSPHPARIADGSAGWNAGLPGITEADGTYRPVTNHELQNNRGVREYAKRCGLEPMTTGRYRGLK